MVIRVNFDNGGYDVAIKKGGIGSLPSFFELERKILIVSDSLVPKDYTDKVLSQCKNAEIFIIKSGEENKTLGTVEQICKKMLDSGFERNDAVIALGGGMVGDIAGFAASIYERGIDFYNIPSTLLAQIDSSVGGKTAVNFGGIKNSIGTFKRPEKVLIDTDLTKTLPKREYNCGIAEAIKIAAIMDKEYFALLESDDSGILSEEMIKRAIILKRNIVEWDEKERSLRRSLNFGHTVGHGIEIASNGKLLHGECVAIGMMAFSEGKAHDRIKNLLQKFGLPTSYCGDKEAIAKAIYHDKKALGGKIRTIWVNEIGKFEEKALSLEDINERIELIK